MDMKLCRFGQAEIRFLHPHQLPEFPVRGLLLRQAAVLPYLLMCDKEVIEV